MAYQFGASTSFGFFREKKPVEERSGVRRDIYLLHQVVNSDGTVVLGGFHGWIR